MASASELIAQLNALDGDERAAALTLLANDGGGVVKEFRSKQFAAGKSEGGKSGKASAEELTTAKTRIEELEAELADVKAKAPDVAKLEEGLKAKHAKELEKERQRVAALATENRTLKVEGPRAKLAKELGGFVVEEWVDDVAAKYADRISVDDDGARKILKPGETTEYEAASEDEKVKLLAGDIKKQLAPRYLRGQGESGGGVGGGNGGGGGGVDRKALKERALSSGIYGAL